jgi:glycosyltransferase involved in cell wall biosynthesis
VTVSVIIPCFNCEEYVSRAISSVLNQTHKVDEIILVNNNSTDNTKAVLLEWKLKYGDRIKVLDELKKGATSARNKGLEIAKSVWIQFLDADDELLPVKIKTQLDTSYPTDNIDVIVGGCFLITSNQKRERPLETSDIWKGLITSQLGITSANLYRREQVLKIGGWNTILTSSQEYELMFRLLKKDSVIRICKPPLTNIYIQNNSIHKSTSVERLIEILENNVNLRAEIKKFLMSANQLTPDRRVFIDKYIYAYLVHTTGMFPLFNQNSLLGEYLKEKIRQTELNLPFSFKATHFFKLLKKKFKNRTGVKQA